jgi:hypothetical protein
MGFVSVPATVSLGGGTSAKFDTKTALGRSLNQVNLPLRGRRPPVLVPSFADSILTPPAGFLLSSATFVCCAPLFDISRGAAAIRQVSRPTGRRDTPRTTTRSSLRYGAMESPSSKPRRQGTRALRFLPPTKGACHLLSHPRHNLLYPSRQEFFGYANQSCIFNLFLTLQTTAILCPLLLSSHLRNRVKDGLLSREPKPKW